MAGVMLLRVTVSPRILFSRRTFDSFGSFNLVNLRKFFNTKFIVVRSFCLLRAVSQKNLSTWLRTSKSVQRHSRNGCRLLNYSCCRSFSHSTNTYSNYDKSDKKHDLKDNKSCNTEKYEENTELRTILKATDFGDDVRCTEKNNETLITDKIKLEQLKVEDTSMFYNKNDKNKSYTGFEYDYQVAEDVEEYEYFDERKLSEQQLRPEKVLPINLERGKDGVFDLDELVILLENLGAENIVTFPVPPEANFCDHMVVASAKSRRHLQAINDEMFWVHKRKKSEKDHHLVIEGMNKSNWCAMDMGNIVLHVFYGESREFYNIESLWTLGPDQDPLCQQQSIDPYVLSAEDLFWLEAGKTAGKDQVAVQEDNRRMAGSDGAVSEEKSKDWHDQVTESDAGWGPSKPIS